MTSIFIVALGAFVICVMAVIALAVSPSRVWDGVAYFVIYASGVVSVTAAAMALISGLL